MSRINVGHSMDTVIKRIMNTMARSDSTTVENARLKD
jgi:hypothetical protein